MPPTDPPIFDGHNDSLQALYLPHGPKRDLLVQNKTGHIDLPRAELGGFCGGLFALFSPPPQAPAPGKEPEEALIHYADLLKPIDFAYALEMTQKGIQSLYDLESASQGKLCVVRDMAALEAAMQKRVIAAVMHFEGAEAIDPELGNLEEYYAAGLRSLGLVWSRPNAFGHGVDFTPKTNPDQGPGLTQAGKALVKACNQFGILVDLSHLNEKGFWDVQKITTAPLVASHSCVYSLSPSPRNLLDTQLDAIAASGGLVGINFAVSFLRPDNRRDPHTPLSDLVRHFTYIAERNGVEHVAFGSDFDGATIPEELGDVAGLPKLMVALRSAGFSENDLEQIAYRNWLRVLTAAWKA